MSAPEGVPARAAATVILVRDGAAGVEVFLMRRPEKSSFFGGAYVFPGGAVDPQDGGEAIGQHLGAARLEACRAALDPTPGRELDAAGAAGFFVAACREAFEECGVLLVRDGRGAGWTPPPAARLPEVRRRLHAGEVGLAAVLEELGARLDLGALAYWAHWITPSVERKRFDTRFFVARMPAGQEASIDAAEAVDHRWATPAAALAASVAGEIVLPPPTYRNLEELAELTAGGGDVDELWRALVGRRVHAIMPKIGAVDGGIAILLPWDPLYPGCEGEALAVSYPAAWTAGPSRIVLHEGRWESRRG